MPSKASMVLKTAGKLDSNELSQNKHLRDLAEDQNAKRFSGPSG